MPIRPKKIPALNDKLIKRFWQKVERKSVNECWNWLESKRNGYGCFCINRKGFMAHRISYILYHHSDPAPLFVCHSCDNPSCVNPRHLFIGSQLDNIQDCIRKNRFHAHGLPGEKSTNHKLNNEQVKSIRKMYKTGFNKNQLAKKFHVHRITIHNIVCYKTWKHTNTQNIRYS